MMLLTAQWNDYVADADKCSDTNSVSQVAYVKYTRSWNVAQPIKLVIQLRLL